MAKVFSLHEGELTEVQVEGFHSEEELVRLLEDHPKLIPADEIAGEALKDGPPLQFMVLKREAGVTPGSIDLLLIDNQAVPTVVEAKLRANREIRRAVLGQGLEYVADLATRNARELWEIAGKDLSDFKALWGTPEGEMDEETFLSLVEENLAQGHIRLIILADELLPETRKVIEFLNRYSNLLVFGMEVKRIPIDEEGKVIIVDLIGPSEKDRARKQRARGPSYADCLVRVKELVLERLSKAPPGEGFTPVYVTARPSRLLDLLLLHPNPQGGDHWEGDLGYTVNIREGEWRAGFKLWPTQTGGYQRIMEEVYQRLVQRRDEIDGALGELRWEESKIRRAIYDPWESWGCPREALAAELAPKIAERLIHWIRVLQPILNEIRGVGGIDGEI